MKFRSKEELDSFLSTLKFIGEDFNDFDEYYALSTCFGDLYTIKKLKNFVFSTDAYRIPDSLQKNFEKITELISNNYLNNLKYNPEDLEDSNL